MCGIWDWQSKIVKDLNDSQDHKHTLFCRENAFVAIYAFFRQQMSAFYPFRDIVCFFLPFFSYELWIMMASLNYKLLREKIWKNPNAAKVIWRLQAWERQICHDMRTQKDTRIHPCHIWPKCHCMLKAPTWREEATSVSHNQWWWW